MTIKSFQGLGLVNHNIPPPQKKNCKLQKTSKKELYHLARSTKKH